MNPISFEIFCAYASADEELRKELEKHLSLLKRQGIIRLWHFRKITGGKEFDADIDEHLNTANIILLLISPDFIASDYCYDIEMRRAMQRHKAGEAWVIPVILRSCDWKSAPFGKLLALPSDGLPVDKWKNRDEAFENIALGIRNVCKEMRVKNVVKSVQDTSLLPSRSVPATGAGHVYCSRCGIELVRGERTECVGSYYAHDFEVYKGNEFCRRCGVRSGKRTECVGSYYAHDFVSR